MNLIWRNRRREVANVDAARLPCLVEHLRRLERHANFTATRHLVCVHVPHRLALWLFLAPVAVIAPIAVIAPGAVTGVRSAALAPPFISAAELNW